jgi:chemotaxis protein CheC
MTADINSRDTGRSDMEAPIPPAPQILTDIELDALTELVNIGVSRAANSLRELVGEQVLLSVPTLLILERALAASFIEASEGAQLVAVRQVFQGEFSGSALLIFPERNSLELVRAVTRDELTLDDIVELEQEALAEVGNILLNSCVATIANLLERNLEMSLPEILRGDSAELLAMVPTGQGDSVLFVHINFTLKGRQVSGFVAIVMDFLSLAALQGLIASFIQRSAG